MATSSAIRKALAVLQAVFARDITPELAEAYRIALADVSDDDLGVAVGRCLQTCMFFPVPAELRGAIHVDQAPKVNAADVIAKIASLSTYMPTGYAHPSVPVVRDKLGAAAAEAYGFVGSRRLFSENQTTRDIAERDFAATFAATVQDEPRTALPRTTDRMLDGPMHPDLVKRLKAETTA